MARIVQRFQSGSLGEEYVNVSDCTWVPYRSWQPPRSSAVGIAVKT